MRALALREVASAVGGEVRESDLERVAIRIARADLPYMASKCK